MAPAPATPEEAVYAGVRARVAFERLVMAVLYGALISAGLVFIIRAARMLTAASLAPVSLIFDTAYYAFAVFLGGFLAAVVIGAPLFEVLEKRKIRKAWPWFAAAIFGGCLLHGLMTGAPPFLAGRPIGSSLSFLAPGLIMAALFTRAMGPVWRAAEKAERDNAGSVVRLH